jgi:hypothetical protein
MGVPSTLLCHLTQTGGLCEARGSILCRCPGATAAGTPGSSEPGPDIAFHPDLVPGIGWDALLEPAAGAGDAGSGQCGHLARVPSGS